MDITSNVFLVLGLVIFLLAVAQLLSVIFGSFRQHLFFRSRTNLSLKLLEKKIVAEQMLIEKRKDSVTLGWSGFRKFRVDKLVKESNGVTSVIFKPHDGNKLPGFEPGQYLTFNLKVPGEEKPLVRCYSLSDAPTPKSYRITVKKVPPPRDRPELPSGKSSSYFNDVVKEGDLIDVKAPSGAFHVGMQDKFPIVLIGGGIGITPVYSMLKAHFNIKSEREIHLFYGVRNEAEIIYKKDLEKITDACPNVKIHLCYSSKLPAEEDQHKEISYYNGRVTVDLMKGVLPSPMYNFYICGPGPLMGSITAGLDDWGVPKDRVHFEAFGPATVKKKPATDAPAKEGAAPAAAGPKVKFAVTGKEFAWEASNDSLLEFGESKGIDLSFGCRVGNCGNCSIALKSGEVDYEREPGAEIEKGSVLTCVAIPKTEVELDA